jgi:hypothetical protein
MNSNVPRVMERDPLLLFTTASCPHPRPKTFYGAYTNPRSSLRQPSPMLKGAKLRVPKAAKGWEISARQAGFVLEGLPSLRLSVNQGFQAPGFDIPLHEEP